MGTMELLFSLVAGLIIAIAFQLLLANFGIALGLTVLSLSPQEKQPSSSAKTDKTSKAIALPITHLLGFGVALSLSTVLFAAGLLSTEFSEIVAPRRGIIFGIVLWATYWLLFVWLSSTTLSSIADSLLGTALSGGRRLITAIQQAMGTKEKASDEQARLEELAEEIAALAKQQQQLPQQLAAEKEALLAEIAQLADDVADNGRQTAAPPAPVIENAVIEDAVVAPSSSSSFLARLDLPSRRQLLQQVADSLDLPSRRQLLQRAADSLDLPSGQQLLQQAADQAGMSDVDLANVDLANIDLANIDLPNIDLPNIDIQALWHQLRSGNSTSRENIIQLDVADYLSQAPAWMLRSDSLKDTFYDRIYDPEAAPEQLKAQLAAIDRSHFDQWLQEREDLAADQVAAIAEQLSQVRDAVIEQVSAAVQTVPDDDQTVVSQEAIEHVQTKLIAYCRYTNLDMLTPDSLAEKVQTQLEENDLENSAIAHLDLASIEQILDRRQGLEPARHKALLKTLRSLGPRSSRLSAPRRWAERSGRSAQHLSKTLAAQLSYYLQHQDKSAFSPTQMARDLTQLTKATVGSFPKHLPPLESLFDKTAWQQELEKRRDLTTDEIQHIVSEAESAWHHSLQQVNSWAETSWSALQETLDEKSDELLGTAGKQVSKQLATAQQAIESKVDAVKADLQTQADMARGQVAIAAWWLFISLLLSGASAGASGWLAVMY